MNCWIQLWKKELHFVYDWVIRLCRKLIQQKFFFAFFFQVGIFHSMALKFTVQILYFTTASPLFSLTPLIFCHKGQYFPYWKSHTTSVNIVTPPQWKCDVKIISALLETVLAALSLAQSLKAKKINCLDVTVPIPFSISGNLYPFFGVQEGKPAAIGNSVACETANFEILQSTH